MRMNLKKYATLLLTANLTLSGFCGCAATKADNQQLPLQTAVYSNLTDEESRSLLRQGLSDAGVKENRIDTLFAKVDAFRADVKSEWLTNGFESAAPTETKYDPCMTNFRIRIIRCLSVMSAFCFPQKTESFILSRRSPSRSRIVW